MEPEYAELAAYNKVITPAAAALQLVTSTTRPANPEGLKEIAAARGSKSLESDTYWVVHLVTGYRSVVEVPGYTVEGADNYESSSIHLAEVDAFLQSIPDFRAASMAQQQAARLEQLSKATVHEVFHQISSSPNHIGNSILVTRYNALSDADKTKQIKEWRSRFNIMNSDLGVPSNNPLNTPAVGDYDLYYFDASQIKLLRNRVSPPGTP